MMKEFVRAKSFKDTQKNMTRTYITGKASERSPTNSDKVEGRGATKLWYMNIRSKIPLCTTSGVLILLM